MMKSQCILTVFSSKIRNVANDLSGKNREIGDNTLIEALTIIFFF